jgi:hypothetical protein
MTNHSMVVDDFFENPKKVRDLLDMVEMKDYKFSDGVTYPNIIRLPKEVENEIGENMRKLFGHSFNHKLSFGRYSFENTKPPHWAHSDRNIAQFLALIYMTPGIDAEKFGTATLTHIETGMTRHPVNDFQKEIILAEANDFDAWEINHECRAIFNRCFILNGELIHAALGEHGTGRNDGRLVVSVFFDLEN